MLFWKALIRNKAIYKCYRIEKLEETTGSKTFDDKIQVFLFSERLMITQRLHRLTTIPSLCQKSLLCLLCAHKYLAIVQLCCMPEPMRTMRCRATRSNCVVSIYNCMCVVCRYTKLLVYYDTVVDLHKGHLSHCKMFTRYIIISRGF